MKDFLYFLKTKVFNLTIFFVLILTLGQYYYIRYKESFFLYQISPFEKFILFSKEIFITHGKLFLGAFLTTLLVVYLIRSFVVRPKSIDTSNYVLEEGQERVLYLKDLRKFRFLGKNDIFDLFVTEKMVYFIKLPYRKMHAAELLATLLAPGVGAYARSENKDKRDVLRSSWIFQEQILYSDSYKKYVDLEMTRDQARYFVKFGLIDVKVKHNGQARKFLKNFRSLARFKKVLVEKRIID